LNESTGAVVWTAQPAGATLYTGAVIDAVKGLVIVGSFNGYVSALDIADGSTKWSFSLLSGSWFVAPPQVDLGWDNGTGNAFGLVLIGDFNPAPSTTRGLYAINETDGSLIWKFTVPWSPPGGFGITSTAAVSNGRVFIGTVGLGGVGGTFYCLNETSGAVIWSRPSNGNFGGAPAIADGKVFIGTGGATTGNSGGYALALDEATGAVVWNVSLAYWTAMKVGATQGPAVDVEEGAVYFEAEAPGGAQGGTLAKLNMTDGSTVWKFTFASFPEGQGDGGNAPYIPASAPALATRDGQKLVYISGVDNPYTMYNGHEKVFCFNADTGALVWSYLQPGGNIVPSTNPGQSYVLSSPIIADDHCFVGSYNDLVTCFGYPPRDGGTPPFVPEFSGLLLILTVPCALIVFFVMKVRKRKYISPFSR
jgi:outer membrane protein assembly factor BamB